MNNYVESGNPDDIALGRALIQSGKVGCIVLAGGDGSRLGWEGPKGTFPLSLVKQKSLFQMLSEKVEASSRFFGAPLKLAVMTSPINHEITRDAFHSHTGEIHFFKQNLAPILDENKQPLEEARPNGNGEVLHRFYETGLFQKWKDAGVEHVQVILIDNPLAEPFDPNLCGYHSKKGAEVTMKAVIKNSSDENVGVIGKKKGKVRIIEYSENPPKEWNLANTSLFCFSMDFIEKIKDSAMPIHEVKKFLNSEPIYKQECFIFDLLPHSETTEVIVYPREEIFAPLKTRKDVGPVQAALLKRDRKAFQAITGNEPAEKIFELDASFHYPTEEFKQKWEGSSFPKSGYIEP